MSLPLLSYNHYCVYRLQWVTKNTTDPMVRWGTASGNYPYTKQVGRGGS